MGNNVKHEDSTMDIIYKRSVLRFLDDEIETHSKILSMYQRYIKEGKVKQDGIDRILTWHKHVVSFCKGARYRIKRKRLFATWVNMKPIEG